MVFGIPLSSVYCNTLLANLNARTYIRGGTTAPDTGADAVMMSLPITKADSEPEKQIEGMKHELISSTDAHEVRVSTLRVG